MFPRKETDEVKKKPALTEEERLEEIQKNKAHREELKKKFDLPTEKPKTSWSLAKTSKKAGFAFENFKLNISDKVSGFEKAVKKSLKKM